jgi:hypothetical protein
MNTDAFFHERHAHGFRARFRDLLSRATRLDTAVTRLRLTTLDFSEEELRSVETIRLIVAELRAVELDAEAHALVARPGPPGRLERLESLLTDGRVELRVVPLAGWSPDFSIFSGPGGATALLMGFHAFERPHPYSGPALGAELGGEAATQALARFEEIWHRGHDVSQAVEGVFRRARRWMPLRDPEATVLKRRSRAVDSLPGLG